MSDREALEEERDFCLRSLRDLDAELAAGDIDAADYEVLRDSYTVRAAASLRALDGLDPRPAIQDDAGAVSPAPATARTTPMNWRRRVGVAAGALLVAGGSSWAVVASSATRIPGQEITGQALGSQQISSQLIAAQSYLDKGDDVSALKAYQKILMAQPDQPEALTGEGWLLAQTQQPALLRQGLGMLASAERYAPAYAPAHLYRGISLLSEDDYADAIPELQWYLGHSPDPALAPKVRQALQQAQAQVQG
jgi:tetratricopeptide (TPR) repeat protein